MNIMSINVYLLSNFIYFTFFLSSSSDEDMNEIFTTKSKPQYVRTCASELYYRRDDQV